MTNTQFDPARFKTTQRANWNAMSGGWLAWADKFERGAAVVSDRLLALGGVRVGSRVLDIGTGVGEPAVRAAGVVGPSGRVTAIDLAEDMVTIARRRAAGLPNVTVWRGDIETVDLPAGSFDVALSRWGLMFAPDPVAAFRAVAAALVPGGTLAASVWGPPDTAPMLSLGFRVLSRRLDLPTSPPGEPSPYSMADPDRLTTDLRTAGFTDVSITEFGVPFWLTSRDEYVEFYRTCSPPGLLTMIEQRFGSVADPDTWQAVAASVEPYRTATGRISLTSVALLVRAVAPVPPRG